MSDLSQLHKPLQKRVFLIFFGITFAVSVLILVVGYVQAVQSNINGWQNRIMGIATKTAIFIPVESHEAITSFDDTKTDSYGILRLYLQSILSANPDIDDVYTLRPTEDPKIFTYVVVGKDTEDENKDGMLDDAEIAPSFGEPYDVRLDPDVIIGLSSPVVDDQIRYNKGDSWLSAFAPLRDAENNAVAVVGVDVRADVILQSQHNLLRSMSRLLGIITIFLLVIAYAMSRLLTKPIKTFAVSIDKVLHGEYTFHLSDKGKGEEHVFAVLFNHLVDAFKSEKEQLEKEKNK